ncbi:MFS transporter [Pseudonocardia sp. S2-4]|uniref:MFS transporter n=1 Tax=Pseudonocardia humida TaxID=2800819 RepID=A0ABT1A935_9PSEU|nr:MFS transporter [Pseudonocardia humida]
MPPPGTAGGVRGAPFRLTLGATVLGFGGYALLLPVVPLWAARGGAGALGAGVTTGALMLSTVLTQLAVPWLLHRIGHRWVLGVGLLLLGGPAPLFALSAAAGPVIAVSALRGVGFGLVTVVGAALVAELVPPHQHGRATGWYGIAVGAPQLVLLAIGVAAVERLGFLPVFVAGGVAPVLGALLVPFIRVPARSLTPATHGQESHHQDVPRPDGGFPDVAEAAGAAGAAGEGAGGGLRAGVRPLLAMVVCSLAQGGLVTFLPLAVPGSGAPAAAALLVMAAGGLVGRVGAGLLVDRFGIGGRVLGPATLLTALGTGLAAVLLDTGSVGVLVGATLVGVGFGAVQNDSLTTLFAVYGPARYGAASAAWNIAFDGGTGVGAVGLGALADPFGFRVAFGVAAVVCLGTGLVPRPRTT